jgi:opacity protein-like surface antigen
MRVKWIGVTLALMALVPGRALAQDKRIVAEIGMGPTVLFGPAADHFGGGFNFDLGINYKLNPKFAVRLDTLVTKHDVKDEITNQLGVGDGDGWIWHLSGNGVMFKPINDRFWVHGIAGLGFYHRKINLTNPGTDLVTVCDPWIFVCYPIGVPATDIAGARSSSDFGVNFGGGLDFRIGENHSAFIEFRYHYVWGPKGTDSTGASRSANTQMMPITIGIRF